MRGRRRRGMGGLPVSRGGPGRPLPFLLLLLLLPLLLLILPLSVLLHLLFAPRPRRALAPALKVENPLGQDKLRCIGIG